MLIPETMLIRVFELAIPWLVKIAQQATEHGVDPATLDWEGLYARSIADIQAEVDARRREADGSRP